MEISVKSVYDDGESDIDSGVGNLTQVPTGLERLNKNCLRKRSLADRSCRPKHRSLCVRRASPVCRMRPFRASRTSRRRNLCGHNLTQHASYNSSFITSQHVQESGLIHSVRYSVTCQTSHVKKPENKLFKVAA